jgi:type I restriction enzyme S subunit
LQEIDKDTHSHKYYAILLRKKDKVPEEWDLVTLEDIIEHKNAIRIGPFGSSLKKHELLDRGEIKTLWIENIVNNQLTLNYEKYITKEKYQELKSFTVKPDDVLITMMGTIGRVAVIPNDIGTAIISSHLLKITLNKEKCLSNFLYNYLMSDFVRDQFNKQSRGIVMGGLNSKIIRKLLVKLPPVKQQQKISSILSKLDELIQKTDQVIQQTQKLKKGLMQKLLNKGIGHTKFKKIRSFFGRYLEIPEEWEVVQLGFC